MDDLFPFIYEASKRLSSRAISRWLEQEKGIKISNVTVAKALRNPEKYWEDFAERLDPSIRTIENETHCAAQSFLDNASILDHLSENEFIRLQHEDADGDGNGSADMHEAVNMLKELWFPLSPVTRREILPYILASYPIVTITSAQEGGNTDES